MATRKRWYRSPVLWANALAAAFGVLEGMTNLIGPALGVTNVQFLAGYSILLAVGNAVLRVITTQALAFGKPEADD